MGPVLPSSVGQTWPPGRGSERLISVLRVKPQVELAACVTQAHIMEVVDGEGEFSVIHEGQGNETLDAMHGVLFGGVVRIVHHGVRGPKLSRRVFDGEGGDVGNTSCIGNVIS